MNLVLAAGDVVATVSPRAASLRGLVVRGVPIVEPTAHRAAPPGMSGAVLVPWPNRVEDATWEHAGRTLSLPVNEPELGHALHGLLSGTDFVPEAVEPGRAVLTTGVAPSPGYPFSLEVRVEYALQADGVRTEVEIRNVGETPAPVAVGAHPYLRIGDWATADLVASIDADTEWELDHRHIPRRRSPHPRIDPRATHPVDEAPAHTLYERRPEQRDSVRHAFASPDGQVLELIADPTLRWTQWYVTDALDTADGPRRALAVEPMSAPPNALRTGESLRLLDAGERGRWGWTLRLR